MAGSKSLGVYSLDEAATHFTAALALLDKNPACASDDQVADFLVSYAALLNMSGQMKVMIDVLQRYLARIDRLGDDPRAVLIRHQYVVRAYWNTRYREAAAMQRETSPIADRLGDSRSKAYSLAGEIHVSTMIAPKPLDEFEILKKKHQSRFTYADAYIQNWTRFGDWVGGYAPRTHERSSRCSSRADAGWSSSGRSAFHRPRLGLLTWIASESDSYAEALEYSEQSLRVAITPF